MTITILGPQRAQQKPEKAQVPAVSALSAVSGFQLSVVLSALCHGISQASIHHQMPPRTIGSWIRQQERELSHRRWLWETEKVAEWVLGQWEQQLEVSKDALLQTAKKALGEDGQLTDCYHWSVDFMLKHELCQQPIFTESFRRHRGRLPRSIRERSRSFKQALTAQMRSSCVPPHGLGSMDEFSIFIDPHQFSAQNSSALRMFGSPKDKPTFDVVLSALSNGTFLPPLLFFRGNPSPVPEGFPDNVLLEARQEGFSDLERHEIWINKVWFPHAASQCSSESVLMVDIHRDHLVDKFRRSLSDMSTDVTYIPSACSCCLQPLDVCVTPVIRGFLQARWTQLVSVGGLDGFGLDQLALTLACWFSEICFTLNTETHILRRSFKLVCNLQEVEEQGETMRMIHALTEALVQPLETPEPQHDPEPEQNLELRLVVEKEKRMAEKSRMVEKLKEKRVEEKSRMVEKLKENRMEEKSRMVEKLKENRVEEKNRMAEKLKENMVEEKNRMVEKLKENRVEGGLKEVNMKKEMIVDQRRTEEVRMEVKVGESEEEELDVENLESEEEECSGGRSALRQVFEGESDPESFYGFEAD